eukprot:TRINITY_DN2462_c0_g1_i1.p1 TRINITY_DN2462_c0_g1~~TRINITY_DN2462_c0_g1_i1.p1  ORF type:complete len:749 (+),score=299.61 TRINITY_DN2462_c0_g1_i1:202-2448(+)
MSTQKVNKKRGFNRINKSGVATNPERTIPTGKTHMRSSATIKRLNMYRSKPKRDENGKLISGAFMSRDLPDARIQPDRRWFGNTKVVDQKRLEDFREALKETKKDPYQYVLQTKNVPWSLVKETTEVPQINLLQTESFEKTFGAKSHQRRKKPKLIDFDYESMNTTANNLEKDYKEESDSNILREIDTRDEPTHSMFKKGTSKRIWAELYKVLDSSDVVVQVLDARDPMGTRSPHIEKHLKKNAPHKHLVFLLNKVDLIPTWATARWVRILSQEYPTLAFHASITNPFGKGSLIQLLRQFAQLHSEKKNISVGFIGYPNVGKSSVINTLRKKKVCVSAPIPGQTRVWQYITLFSRIFLIDCPGCVYPTPGEDTTQIVLKGVVKISKLKTPEDHVHGVLERVRKEYLQRAYGILEWKDAEDFLTQFAEKNGKLMKRAEPDIHNCAKMILNDFQRGRVPYFFCPPFDNDRPEDGEEKKPSIPIKQDFRKIPTSNGFEFVESDIKDPSKVFAKPQSVKKGHKRTNSLPMSTEESLTTSEELVDWDDIYKSVQGTEVSVETFESAFKKNEKKKGKSDKGEKEDLEDDIDHEKLDKLIQGVEENSGEEEQKESDMEEKVTTSKNLKKRRQSVGSKPFSTDIKQKKEKTSTTKKETNKDTLNKEKKDTLLVPTSPRDKRQKGDKKRKNDRKNFNKDENNFNKKKKISLNTFEEVDPVNFDERKEPRMTTNKKKIGVHFYDKVNTKNRRNWTKNK